MNEKQLNKLIINATVAKTTLEFHTQQTDILIKTCREKCEQFVMQIQMLRAQIEPITSCSNGIANKELQERLKEIRDLSVKMEKIFTKDVEKPLQKMKSELNKQQKLIQNKLKANLNEVKECKGSQKFLDIVNICDESLTLATKRLNECFMIEQDCRNKFDLLLCDINQHDIPHMIYITDKHAQKLQHDLTALNRAIINNRNNSDNSSLQLLSLRNSIGQLQITCSTFLRSAQARTNTNLSLGLSFSETKPKRIIDLLNETEQINIGILANKDENNNTAEQDEVNSENEYLDGSTDTENSLKASATSAKKFTI